MADEHSTDNQTLWPRTRAGENDHIKSPDLNWLCSSERHEEEEDDDIET